MASLPARRPSQGRTSWTEQSRTPSSQSQTSPARSRSEDSQTIFVNKPDEDEQQQSQTEEREQEQEQEQNGADIDDPNVKRCWVCYCDSTEDTPESSPWRDPCPCALVAHEQCLLDWIADTEASKNDSRGSITGPKITCPQCKAEIRLARPRDYLVDAVRGLERISAKVVIPGSLFVASSTLYHVSMAWGMHSIYAIFGPNDGFRILSPLIWNNARPPTTVYVGPGSTSEQIRQQVIDILLERASHWRLYLGIPLLAPVLILSRTSLADGVLPVLPVVFFASQVHSPSDALDFTQWPPSASFSFALLPYVRTLYNMGYKALFAEKEKRWLQEIQPRTNTADAADGNAAGNANAEPRPADDNVFEVRIDGGIWEDWDEPAEPAAPQQVVEEDEAAPAPDVQDNRPLPNGGENEIPAQQPRRPQEQGAAARQAQGNQPAQAGQRRLAFSPTAIAQSVLGALVFPTLASIAGEALYLVLPRSWTTPAAASSWRWNVKPSPKGFFTQKWARSLVGGCLLVVCKDALMLYVRWKMVQMHRGRRVLDVDRTRRAAT